MITLRTAVLAVLLALGVVVAPGVSGAFWSQSQTAGVAPISTGTLEFLVGDDEELVKAYPFTALAANNMAPGSYGQAPLVIANAGESALVYRLQQWTSPNANLYDSLDLAATRIGDSSQCPSLGSQGGTPVDPSAARLLAPGESERLCLRVTLRDDAQQTLVAGTSGDLTFWWQAGQP